VDVLVLFDEDILDRIFLLPDDEAVMYDTPAGVRVLQGPERRLFVTSLGMIVDLLRTDDFAVDIPVFDELQRNQKVAVLHTIGHALLCDDTPAPDLTAVIEGAVASVFEHARSMVILEIGLPPDDESFNDKLPTWRELVLASARELELEEFPHHNSRDQDTWNFLIECLEGTVLWDNDFEAENRLDAPPEQSHPLKSLLGIPDSYYVAVPWDPSDEEAEKLLQELHGLTRDCR
jgi:hypothetical protein